MQCTSTVGAMDVVRFHEEWNETLYCSNQFFKFYYHSKLFLNRVGYKTQQTMKPVNCSYYVVIDKNNLISQNAIN